jgi:antibiotic biosynthesis monooxygenase (ABM) superfamily enzyme
MRETTFVKDGETYVITKRGLLYIEGYHLIETKNGTVHAYDQIPRNAIGKFFDWLEEVEFDYTGPFWGTVTIVCLVALAFFGWLIFMLEPWYHGIDVSTAIVIATAVAYVVMACFSGWEWATKAIAPWLNERRMAKA